MVVIFYLFYFVYGTGRLDRIVVAVGVDEVVVDGIVWDVGA